MIAIGREKNRFFLWYIQHLDSCHLPTAGMNHNALRHLGPHTYQAFGVRALPAHYLVDRDGRFIRVPLGAGRAGLRQAALELLAR